MTKKILFICLMVLSSTYTLAAGEISMLRGEATVIRAASNLAAKIQMPIKAKDAIETKDNGKLQLTFKDKTVVTIGADTVFSVEDYLFEDKKSKAKFNVKGGSFKVITGKIGKLAPKSFLLKTKTSLIGIRGTVFSGQVGANKGDNDGDYIGCMQGSITVASIKTGEQKSINNGEMLFVNENGSLGEIEKLNEETFNSLARLDGDIKNQEGDNKGNEDSDDNDASDLADFEIDKNTLVLEKTKVTYKGELNGESKAKMTEINRESEAKAKIKADMKVDIDFGGNEPLEVTISNQKLTLEEAKVNGTALTGSDFENAKQSLSSNNSLTSKMEMTQTLNPEASTIKGEYEKTANGLTTKADLDGKFSDNLKELDGTLNETTKGTLNGVEIKRNIKANFDLNQEK